MSLQQTADYFLFAANSNNAPITNKKLQKLVYYAQAWSLALNNDKLFDEPIEAWIHGPAIRALYSRYKKYSYYVITETPKKPELDDKTTKLLDNVWAVYGKYDADYLEILSHNEQPWLSARGNIGNGDRASSPIDTDLMRTFYAGLLKSVKA